MTFMEFTRSVMFLRSREGTYGLNHLFQVCIILKLLSLGAESNQLIPRVMYIVELNLTGIFLPLSHRRYGDLEM